MDGITEVTDLDKTAANKKLVTDFLKAVSVEGDKTKIDECVAEGEVYIQHNAMVGDERDFSQGCGPWTFKYTKTQIVVAESKSSLAHATQHHETTRAMDCHVHLWSPPLLSWAFSTAA